MVSKELIKKIRRIEIKANKLVEEIFSGEYRSGFRGKGIEFDDIRQYYPGDDVRNIDWNVTARQNTAYVKQFQEEREMNLFLLIDQSYSNNFGRKKDIIVEIGATLAFSAIRNNDKVGAMLFTDQIEKLIPSKSGKRHVLSIIEDILRLEPENKGTDLANALHYFNKIVKKQSIVFLISDFLDSGFEKEIKITAQKHDLVLLRIIDPTEEQLPQGAIFAFEDLETGETMLVDNLKGEKSLNPVKNFSARNLINIYTDQDYVKGLKHFFKRRGWK
ncbi:MAG: DUF58 domain-containing protein [Halanaerobiaceae bacterium]